ncbi:membrane fusion protein, adhesin transport system [Sulfurivirga caldicuralii]|uniref:Membrane fusion protein (MFP) family protein n=1 Tax=Sulfurivirga caldicuralii TaxID=364032 RepID=A0A1N6GEW7_9GAMM|nr:HlyD family type I secretion periplasmic adaptor subunit [Sulfurivirga caldicuralii]SIO06080.1 membrane fusion protein, adhesin transport system [Sulfurivirga caldicuralii]
MSEKMPAPRDDDLEFVHSVAQAALEKPTTKSQLLVWSVFLLIAAFLLWANWAQVDVRVQAEGRVIPSSQLQVVQSFDGGIVREIFVKDGDKVKKGQVLMRLDRTQFASSYGENLVKEASLRARIARLRAIVENKPLKLKLPSDPRLAEIYQNEIDLYKRQLAQLKTQENIQSTKIRQAQLELKSAQDQRAQLQESYNLIQKEIRITQPLVKRGYASEVDLLKLKREANDIRSKLQDVQNTIPKLQASIREARAELKKIQQEFQNKAHQELNDAESELAALQETQKALRERVQRTDLVSPVNGIVKRVLVTTIGGVVKPGDPVVEIVPEDDVLIIEARVRPQDIGFLRPGLPAKVKFSAYDFAIYGGLEGKVVNISADTITDEKGDSYYLVRIKTDKKYLGTPEHPLALLPGMTATVDIITGKRTILQYLLNPIVKVKENALKE